MTLVLGMIATSDGAAMTSTAELTPSGCGATERRSYYTAPAAAYRPNQPGRIDVDFDHTGRPVGQVLFLCQRGLGLFGVLEIDDTVADELPDKFYLSGEIEGTYNHSNNRYDDIELVGVAIVDRSATVAKQPAAVIRGDIDDAHCYWANPQRELLREAAAYCHERRWKTSEPHRVAGTRVAEHVNDRLSVINGEPIAVRRPTGRTVPLPGGGFGEIEYSVHRGRILAVR